MFLLELCCFFDDPADVGNLISGSPAFSKPSLAVWKFLVYINLKEMGIPDHLTCLLRNLYAGQEETVRTVPGTTDWFQIGKGEHQGCILSPFIFNLYTEYRRRSEVTQSCPTLCDPMD